MSDRFQMDDIAVSLPTSDPNDLTPKTQAVLLNLLLQLADNKYVLGKRYAEWVNSAPLLEAAVAAAAMTQDELGHAESHHHRLPRPHQQDDGDNNGNRFF